MSEDVDRDQLDAVIAALEERETREDLGDYLDKSLAAFRDMRERDDYPLSGPQGSWVVKVADQLDVVVPVRRGPVPRGAEVPMLFKKGPLKPPGRRG